MEQVRIIGARIGGVCAAVALNRCGIPVHRWCRCRARLRARYARLDQRFTAETKSGPPCGDAGGTPVFNQQVFLESTYVIALQSAVVRQSSAQSCSFSVRWPNASKSMPCRFTPGSSGPITVRGGGSGKMRFQRSPPPPAMRKPAPRSPSSAWRHSEARTGISISNAFSPPPTTAAMRQASPATRKASSICSPE